MRSPVQSRVSLPTADLRIKSEGLFFMRKKGVSYVNASNTKEFVISLINYIFAVGYINMYIKAIETNLYDRKKRNNTFN